MISLRNTVLAIIMILTALGLPAVAGQGTVVTLKGSVIVSSETVSLSDVAVLRDPAGIIDEPGSINVGVVKKGETVSIEVDDVKMRLDVAGVDIKRINFAGEERVKVTRPAGEEDETTRNRATLAEIAEKAVEAKLAELGKDGDVELIEVGMNYMLSPERKLNVSGPAKASVKSNFEKSGLVVIHVPVLEHDGYVSHVPVRFKLTVYRKVAVAARRIRKGQVISTEHLKIENRPDTDPGLPVVKVAGRKASVNVDKDATFTPMMLEELPVVRKGQLVRVRIESDGFSITTMARALEDGAPGAWIEVQNVKTRKNFIARVVDVAEVVVAPDPEPKRSDR